MELRQEVRQAGRVGLSVLTLGAAAFNFGGIADGSTPKEPVARTAGVNLEMSHYPKSGSWNVCKSDTQDVIQLLDPNNPYATDMPQPTEVTGPTSNDDTASITTNPDCDFRWGFDWTGEPGKAKSCRTSGSSQWSGKKSKISGNNLTSTIDIASVESCDRFGKREFKAWPAVINPDSDTAVKIGRQVVFKTNKAMGEYGKYSGGSTKRKKIELKIDKKKIDCSTGDPEVLTIVRTTWKTKKGHDNNQVYAIPAKGAC